jgi:nicotinic acid mononucleotide adenylyltransferase
VQGGSYNPVHLNHIRNFRIAEKYVKSQGHVLPVSPVSFVSPVLPVSAGSQLHLIIVPAKDIRIRNKCANGYPLYQRYKMLQLALLNNPDISIDLY